MVHYGSKKEFLLEEKSVAEDASAQFPRGDRALQPYFYRLPDNCTPEDVQSTSRMLDSNNFIVRFRDLGFKGKFLVLRER